MGGIGNLKPYERVRESVLSASFASHSSVSRHHKMASDSNAKSQLDNGTTKQKTFEAILPPLLLLRQDKWKKKKAIIRYDFKQLSNTRAPHR